MRLWVIRLKISLKSDIYNQSDRILKNLWFSAKIISERFGSQKYDKYLNSTESWLNICANKLTYFMNLFYKNFKNI